MSMRCLNCKHKEVKGTEEPCICCMECGVPYIKGTDKELLIDMYEEASINESKDNEI